MAWRRSAAGAGSAGSRPGASSQCGTPAVWDSRWCSVTLDHCGGTPGSQRSTGSSSFRRPASARSRAAGAAAVPEAQGPLRMDVREARVVLAVQTAETGRLTARDVELARRISVVTEEFRLTTTAGKDDRTVQVLEIGIDAMDIASIRP